MTAKAVKLSAKRITRVWKVSTSVCNWANGKILSFLISTRLPKYPEICYKAPTAIVKNTSKKAGLQKWSEWIGVNMHTGLGTTFNFQRTRTFTHNKQTWPTRHCWTTVLRSHSKSSQWWELMGIRVQPCLEGSKLPNSSIMRGNSPHELATDAGYYSLNVNGHNLLFSVGKTWAPKWMLF